MSPRTVACGEKRGAGSRERGGGAGLLPPLAMAEWKECGHEGWWGKREFVLRRQGGATRVSLEEDGRAKRKHFIQAAGRGDKSLAPPFTR